MYATYGWIKMNILPAFRVLFHKSDSVHLNPIQPTRSWQKSDPITRKPTRTQPNPWIYPAHVGRWSEDPQLGPWWSAASGYGQLVKGDRQWRRRSLLDRETQYLRWSIHWVTWLSQSAPLNDTSSCDVQTTHTQHCTTAVATVVAQCRTFPPEHLPPKLPLQISTVRPA